MKAWSTSLAILFAICCGASPANAESHSTAEYVPPDRDNDRPYRIPFKVSGYKVTTAATAGGTKHATVSSEKAHRSSSIRAVSSREFATTELSRHDILRQEMLNRQSFAHAPVIIEQPITFSEYRSPNQSPNIVEFHSGSQPVAVQPQSIRPSAMSPRIQEFGALSTTAFEPVNAPESTPVRVKPKLQHKAEARGVRSQKIAARSAHQSIHLVPVQQLAVYSATNHQL